MRAIGVNMLPSTALRQSSSAKSLKSPGGGPPALLMRMSGLGQAASSCLRPVLGRHVTHDRCHFGAANLAQFLGRGVERLRAAGTNGHLRALACQRCRTALAEALRCRADDCLLAFDAEIHGKCPYAFVRWSTCPCRAAGIKHRQGWPGRGPLAAASSPAAMVPPLA